MDISVIIPTYKPESYLWECLDSLTSQTLSYEQYEIIVVLNGERNPYEIEIENYIQKHLEVNIQYYYSPLPGVSNARNIGLDNAKGDYVAFVDDDDFVSKNYLEELLKHADVDTIPVCRPLSFIDGTQDYYAYNITRDFDKYSGETRVPFYKPKRFFNGPVYKLIHKDVIGSRRFDVRFKNGEDSLFMFLISDKMKYVEFADSSAIYYRRIRTNSATQSKKAFGYSFRNYTKLIFVHTKIFFGGFPRYNFLFYLNSVLGRVKSIILD